MPREGREFEEAYEWLYSLDERYKVTSPAYLYDKAAGIDREIDVLVEYTDEQGLPRKISIECRDRKSTQNVMWIEQLQQKREDVGLDYIIATTTSKFSEAAITKARYHGIILEQAEMLSKKTVENNVQQFFFDAFFLKFELLELNLFVINKGKMTLKQFMAGLNILERAALLKHLNTDFYFSIDPQKIINENNIRQEDFYTKEDNSMEINGNNVLIQDKKPSVLRDVMFVAWKVRVVPHKISLPLADSISVFDGETRSNKDYRAIYGDDKEYFRIGYLEGKLFTELNLEPRKYMRFASANIGLNTIIPEGVDTTFKHSFDYIAEN